MGNKILIEGGSFIGWQVMSKYDTLTTRLAELHDEINETRMKELMVAVAEGEVYRPDKNMSLSLKAKILEAVNIGRELKTIRQLDEVIRGKWTDE